MRCKGVNGKHKNVSAQNSEVRNSDKQKSPTLEKCRSDAGDCGCLKSCSETSYTLDFSYTSFSPSLSVDSIVTSELNRLRDDYHRALEIKYVSAIVVC